MDKSWLAKGEQVISALNHLRLALASLDAAGAPAHVGAHVDLAINQLQDALPAELVSDSDQIDTNAEAQ